MKLFRKRLKFVAAIAALSALTASAVVATPITELEKILAGTSRQGVAQLDKTGLALTLNEQMQDVYLEGWSTKALTTAEADALFAKFGVRAVWDATKQTSTYITPDNVGRAGILEGDTFMKLNGKFYKGLTLKGYGGNNNRQGRGMGEQPNGSLDFAESIRDMEVSTILAENHVDTYVGVLSVKRANGKSNYVRLSRTALRMEDLQRVHGDDLKKLVDFLAEQMKDEMGGKKLNFAEFGEWLAAKTGDLMARKDYIRFSHASVTNSNLGIGEMVDLGDTYLSTQGGLLAPGEYKSQNAAFKQIAKTVHDNMVSADSSVRNVDFDKLYNEAYDGRVKQLQAFDTARVNLNVATEAELVKIGFTAGEAAEVVKFNLGTADGIIDPSEVAGIKSITRDVRAIIEATTSDFMRLADGSQLASYYVRNVGGAEGVRAILEEARDFMKNNNVSLTRDAAGKIAGDVARVEQKLQQIALERATKLGFGRAVTGDSVTNLSKFIARQALQVIVRR